MRHECLNCKHRQDGHICGQEMRISAHSACGSFSQKQWHEGNYKRQPLDSQICSVKPEHDDGHIRVRLLTEIAILSMDKGKDIC